MTNHSSQACTLSDYPAVVLFSSVGKLLQQPVKYVVDATYHEQGPQTITLAPADKATVIVTGVDGTDCTEVNGDIRLVPSSAQAAPKLTDSLSLHFPGTGATGKTRLCPEPISVSPWQPGDTSDSVGPEQTISPTT